MICVRCDVWDANRGSTLCSECGLVANRIIARWMDAEPYERAPAEEIMDMFGFTRASLDRRVARIRAAGSRIPGRVRGQDNADPQRIPNNTRDEIRRLYIHDAMSAPRLAKRFGCSAQTVRNIVKEMGT
jgi:hypothetical protein